MSPIYVDHAFFVLLLLGAPMWARWGYRRLLRRLEQGAPYPRIAEYRNTLRVQWSFTALLLFWWFASGRSWELLGFGHAPIAPAWIGFAAAGLAVAFLAVQYRSVLGSEERLREMEAAIGDLRPLVPHDEREGRWFRAVSLTAGICEEIAFRGFMIAYLTPLLGLWGALAASSAAFGLGHLYQGGLGVLKTGAVGAVMGLLYLLSGSLWAPIVVHFLVDLNAGELGRRVVSRPPTVGAEAELGV
jgi:membrane protease YdiL (CAAX protease family)